MVSWVKCPQFRNFQSQPEAPTATYSQHQSPSLGSAFSWSFNPERNWRHGILDRFQWNLLRVQKFSKTISFYAHKRRAELDYAFLPALPPPSSPSWPPPQVPSSSLSTATWPLSDSEIHHILSSWALCGKFFPSLFSDSSLSISVSMSLAWEAFQDIPQARSSSGLLPVTGSLSSTTFIAAATVLRCPHP